MAGLWLDITDIPAEGREFTVDDPELWAVGLREFHMDFSAVAPLSATFRVTPVERGVHVTGRLTGRMETPCDRCTAPTPVEVDQPFELFEEEPLSGEEQVEPGLLRRTGRTVELDAAGMLWEEFVLTLPVKPLCSEGCKGLCPSCGKDLNAGPCPCGGTDLDPRMAALRGLTIAKKDQK
ncbi:hypothetical protein NNJEOMEG_03483 [Fundidesulfovibrio magnetotacticus]|uniref:DUF177 domain-containing protein n=1 Tax=Fundidesulfovibrio magnetotacticus TaxID=2730080 RepID=A0A6V8M528_9BACT|nr:DUF177 domain-containing protein [Fundidesulfovibrio magnetotacticus]GFK95615.1 hypothetical protein NNJEOMEG_03483 [Fundidesulfovibrio magnetotacticus]